MKKMQKFLKKLKIVIWSSNPISAYISKWIENRILKIYQHSNIHCSVLYNSQDMDKT